MSWQPTAAYENELKRVTPPEPHEKDDGTPPIVLWILGGLIALAGPAALALMFWK